MENFVSLTKTLTARDFGRKFAELSAPKRALVERRFPPVPDADSGNPRRPIRVGSPSLWILLTRKQRLQFAAPSDFQRDPANRDLLENAIQLQGNITARIESLTKGIDRLEFNQLAGQSLDDDYEARDAKLSWYKREHDELRAQDRELLDANSAELRAVVERLTKLCRLRDAGGPAAPTVAIPSAETDDSTPEARRRQGASVPRKRKPGPKPGDVARFRAADRSLFPEIERLKASGLSVTAAAQQLADKGKIAKQPGGTTTPASLARRLVREYRKV